MATDETLDGAGARARAWLHARHAAICDVTKPWAHGTVVRATSYPSYYDFNVVRVEDDPEMTVQELAAFADDGLAGLAHRRLDFDLVDVAEPLRAGFEALGWRSLRLLFMRHEVPSSAVVDVDVEEVPYDSVDALRVAWHAEDFPDLDPGDYHAHAKEVALARGARVFTRRDEHKPVAYAQLEGDDAAAEITQVYVHPDHRGNGLGTAITGAAIAAAGPVHDLWICDDDEDRPKELYGRLGFRPSMTMMEFTRLP